MNEILKSNLPKNIVTKSVYSAIRWSNKFNIKNITKKVHEHDVTYDFKCPEENCNEIYVRRKDHRLLEYTMDAINTFKHLKMQIRRIIHPPFLQFLKVNIRRFRKKVVKLLFLKEKWSMLNAKQKSLRLRLLNWSCYFAFCFIFLTFNRLYILWL